MPRARVRTAEGGTTEWRSELVLVTLGEQGGGAHEGRGAVAARLRFGKSQPAV